GGAAHESRPPAPSSWGQDGPRTASHFASKQRTAVLRPHAPPQGPWSSTGAALAPAHRGARPVPERKRKRRAAGSSRTGLSAKTSADHSFWN
ncbi:mCG140640, isoform CRA_b, partial [Mus musculus]